MRREPERWYPLSVALALVGYSSYAISKGGFMLCALVLALFLTPFPVRKKKMIQWLTHQYLGFFTQTWLPFLGIYRIEEISGLDEALAGRPAVLVANHRSFMDSVLLLGLVPRTGAVGKARHHRQPTYIVMERHFDLVGLDPHSLSSVASATSRCREILAAGTNLLTFPEGTRARSGRLQRFGRLPFELAVASQTPIVPVVVHSTCPFMANVPGSIFPRGRNVFRIRFLSPETPRPGLSAEALSDRVYRRIAAELKTLDQNTCWDTTKPQQAAKGDTFDGPTSAATPIPVASMTEDDRTQST